MYLLSQGAFSIVGVINASGSGGGGAQRSVVSNLAGAGAIRLRASKINNSGAVYPVAL